jgi:hypothetical protein
VGVLRCNEFFEDGFGLGVIRGCLAPAPIVATGTSSYGIDYLTADADGGTTEAKRRAAIAAWASMVGAMVLARIVDDEELSREILSETRASLPLR